MDISIKDETFPLTQVVHASRRAAEPVVVESAQTLRRTIDEEIAPRVSKGLDLRVTRFHLLNFM